MAVPLIVTHRRRRWVFPAVLLVACALALASSYLYWRSQQAASGTPASMAVPVTRGNLEVAVESSGNVSANRSLAMAFQTSGQVEEVLVKVGDRVKAGQPLARLDDQALRWEVQTAEASLKSAKARLEQLNVGPSAEELASAEADLLSSRSRLSELLAGSTPGEIAAAESDLASAEAKLADLEDGPTEAELSAAKAQVASAEANLAKVQSSNSASKEQARIAWEQSANDVRAAQLSYSASYHDYVKARDTGADPVTGKPINDEQIEEYRVIMENDWLAEQKAEQAMAKAEISYEEAKTQEILAIQDATVQLEDARKQLEDLIAGSSKADLAAARAAVDSARNSLDTLKAGATESDITSARSTIAQSEAQWAELTAPATASDTAAAEADVINAQIALEEAKSNLDKATLSALFDGLVTDVPALAGVQVSSSDTAVTIVDDSAIYLDIELSESDVAKVKVGQVANITFDALPGETITGNVESIALVATEGQDVVTYLVQVKLSGESAGIKAGMSANASIVTDRREDVLMVPNRAIKTSGSTKTVQVLYGDNNTPVTVGVETGVTNGTMTEIVSCLDTGNNCLREGDQVLVSVASTSSTTTQPGTSPSFGFGPGEVGGVRIRGQ